MLSPTFPKDHNFQAESDFIKLNLPDQYVWDFTNLSVLSYKDFYDKYHLNRKGVKKFMHALEKNNFCIEGLVRQYLKINGKWEDHLLLSCIKE